MRTTAILAALLSLGACARQAGVAGMSPSEGPIASDANRELLPDEQIQQVLNRLAFGARPGDVERVRSMGVDRWIDLQLHPERIDDSRMDAMLRDNPAVAAKNDDLLKTYQAFQRAQRQLQLAQTAQGDSNARRDARQQILAQNPELASAIRQQQRLVGELQAASLARAVGSERQLDESMVDFWENHFSVFAGKGLTRLFLADYDRDVIRPHAMGKFRDLLGAVAKSPAMLFFLDNWESAADSLHPTLASTRRPILVRRMPLGRQFPPGVDPHTGQLPPAIASRLTPEQRQRWEQATPEQRTAFIRQLQQGRRARAGLNENYARELMELHTLGVDGGYTQQDVINVARALTGWTFNRQTGEFTFNPALHDAGEKIVLGHRLPAGRGIEDGEDVLDILARAPATAHFITTKLARHFISDTPPASVVDRCASTFERSDGDIRTTVGCIVTSPEFFSRAAYRAKVKTPFEVVASGLRALGAEPDTTPRSAQAVARLGQPIFGRQTPDGWPDRGDAWMNTGAILNRINFGLALAAGQLPGAKVADWPETAQLQNEPRPEQVDGVIKAILGGSVSPETRAVLMSGDNPMLSSNSSAATMASDTAGDDSPIGSGARRNRGRGGQMFPVGRSAPVLQGLPQIVGLALGAPEFQRR